MTAARRCAPRNSRNAGSGGGFFKKMWSGAGSSPQVAKAKMAMGKNPAEAMAIAEQILNGDPNSSAAHRLIVDAAQALELPQTAVMSLDILVKNSPKDKNLAMEYAHAVGTPAAIPARRKGCSPNCCAARPTTAS